MFKNKKPQVASATPVLPTTPTEYPDGTVAVTDSGRWYLKGKYKYEITSERVFWSWHFPLVVKTTDAAIAKYVRAGKLGFRAGTLLYNDGRYYFVSGNIIRKVSTPDAFSLFQINPAQALWISDDELNLHKHGEVY